MSLRICLLARSRRDTPSVGKNAVSRFFRISSVHLESAISVPIEMCHVVGSLGRGNPLTTPNPSKHADDCRTSGPRFTSSRSLWARFVGTHVRPVLQLPSRPECELVPVRSEQIVAFDRVSGGQVLVVRPEQHSPAGPAQPNARRPE